MSKQQKKNYFILIKWYNSRSIDNASTTLSSVGSMLKDLRGLRHSGHYDDDDDDSTITPVIVENRRHPHVCFCDHD